MKSKIGKVVIDIVLSFVFFVVAAIILDSIAGVFFGNKSNGDAAVNGYVMLVLDAILTIAFGIWFYKYVSLKKNTKEI